MRSISAATVRWLTGYLMTGDATPESRVFRAARQAGHDHRDVRRAARLIGVEMFDGTHTGWWRLPRPPGGSTPIPAPMPALKRKTHPQPRPVAGGAI